MYRIIPWSLDLNLTEFYANANERGFTNNNSKKVLIDCFDNEREKQVWILYYNDKPVGSVAAHSFDNIMGLNGYRIAARTCVFTDQLQGPYSNALRTSSVITKHQNPTAQFFIPKCIEWVNNKGDMYITTHPSNIGTQRLVHNIWAPLLVKTNVLTKAVEVEYRGHTQTFWKLNSDEFLSQLSKVKSWQ